MPSPYPSRGTLVENQLEQLRSLLAELFPANRFYSNKLNEAGVGFDVRDLEDFRSRFPFTTKSEISADQAQHPPFGSNLTYPLSSYTRCHQTSGTSGKPIRWLDTPDSWKAMLDTWTEVLQASEVTASDRIYFAFSFGPFIGFWLAFDAAARLGCLCLPGGGLSSAARVEALSQVQATVLCCTPTYALRLAEAARETGRNAADFQVRKILVAGEPGGSVPGVRERIAREWNGARVYDHHGMTEVGPVSLPCPAHLDRLHILESAFLPEIIDPATGHAALPGSSGELVLTTLTRSGSPLLRYRTGDLVRPVSGNQPCKCGRWDLALDGGILGRVDDMQIVRGVNIYPTAVENIVRQIPELIEYEVVIKRQGELSEILLRAEFSGAENDVQRLARRLSENLQTVLALRVPVEAVPPGTLPRFEMKARRWRTMPPRERLASES